ncbi:DUF2017 family protein [Nesterenkonia ebinurensis]|uniref:DUF2017 family protein n=1 Tax=Nesterenkonia ebinurensis TaxID=2608252 RepID=UPI00123E08AC|nr:DUF2017 family protein [Nesterenkonia ebinurensis]
MARAFRATTRGYKADLESHERRLLSQLCADVITMLEQRTQEVSGDRLSREETRSDAEPPEAIEGTTNRRFADTAQEPGDDPFVHFRRELAGLGAGLGEETEADGVVPPSDPALARLLPEASSDPEEAAQFRRLAESSLRESKIADLRAARLALESDPVTLTEEQAPVFGRALNDVRLTLAARLGIEDEADAEQVHQRAGRGRAATTDDFMAELYAFSTWLQETLFSAMLEVIPDAEGDVADQD